MMDKKIVIFLNDYTALGGVEIVTHNLAKLFTERQIGYISIVSMYAQNKTRKELPNVSTNVLVQGHNKISKLKESKLLKEYLERHKVDILIMQLQSLSVCHLLLKHDIKCLVIPILHNTPTLYVKYHFPLNVFDLSILGFLKKYLLNKPINIYLFKSIMKRVPYFVCLSEKCKIEMKQITTQKELLDKIKVIPNPLTFKSTESKSYDKENRLIYVGRLYRDKHPLELLDIWKNIYKVNENWSFDILGDGPLYLKMKNKIEAENIASVNLLGKIKNPEVYYQRAKICILLSYYEGLPTCLLEASSYKNALVAFDADGGVSDIIEHNVNGLLSDVDNYEILESKLIDLMSDDDRISSMGEKASEKLEAFSDDVIIKKWNKIFQNFRDEIN